jgi:hypothetical protein
VRIITRLDETCREVRDAARVIGDADLYQKMEAAQALIKRDSEYCIVARLTHPSCVCGQLVPLDILHGARCIVHCMAMGRRVSASHLYFVPTTRYA